VGSSGWLFSTGDSQQLAERISEFTALPESGRRQLGQSGYERVQSEYTHQHFSDRLKNILAER
jgi:glycosyltransferase involved in cell wall biosynthesis